jgi:hypothetical protein
MLELRTAADLKIKYGTALRFGTVGLPSFLYYPRQYYLGNRLSRP